VTGRLAPAEREALAAHVMAVIQGLSTLARDGAPRARLLGVVEVAMRAWPEEGLAGEAAPAPVP
jgi:hypothetical protein